MHMEIWSLKIRVKIPKSNTFISDAFLAHFSRTPLHHSVLLTTWSVVPLLHKSITAEDGVTWVPCGLVRLVPPGFGCFTKCASPLGK